MNINGKPGHGGVVVSKAVMEKLLSREYLTSEEFWQIINQMPGNWRHAELKSLGQEPPRKKAAASSAQVL